MFNEDNYSPLPEEDNENWCGGIANTNLAINYEGNFYPCIRYMESSLNGSQPAMILGDINNGYLSSNIHSENLKKISNITRRS